MHRWTTKKIIISFIKKICLNRVYEKIFQESFQKKISKKRISINRYPKLIIDHHIDWPEFLLHFSLWQNKLIFINLDYVIYFGQFVVFANFFDFIYKCWLLWVILTCQWSFFHYSCWYYYRTLTTNYYCCWIWGRYYFVRSNQFNHPWLYVS